MRNYHFGSNIVDKIICKQRSHCTTKCGHLFHKKYLNKCLKIKTERPSYREAIMPNAENILKADSTEN